MPSAMSTDAVSRFGLGRTAMSSRSRPTTATCCSMSVAAGIPASASSPPPAPRQPPARKGIEIVRGVLRACLARSARRRGQAGGSDRRQQRAGACPGHQRFRRRLRAAARSPRAWPRSSFRTCCSLVAGNQFDTIYHEHFSYLSLTGGRSDLRRERACRCSMSRSCRPTAAACVFTRNAATRANSPGRSRVDALASEEVRAGLRTAIYYSGFQARAEASQERSVAFLIEPSARKDRRGLRRRRQGQHAAEFRRVRPRPVRFVVDRNPAKQGKSCRAAVSRLSHEQHMRAASRTTSSSCRGTSR